MLHKEEFPLDTLNCDDLLLQFKLMRAMGFKSLFDPDFRRELRNPIRRALYYKLVMYEEAVDRYMLFTVLDGISDKINFFQDPEMYRKVKQQMEQSEMLDPSIAQEKEQQAKVQMDKALERYVPMTDQDKQEIVGVLQKV
jgi:hypothetical protein